MATYLGKEGVLKAVTTGGTAVLVAELTGWNLTAQAEIIDDTAIGDTWATKKTGIKSWSGSCECWFDGDDAAQVDLQEGEEVDLEFYPEGDSLGNNIFTGTARISSIEAGNGGVNGNVTYSVNFEGTGALTRATA